jgi:hypothetical protein
MACVSDADCTVPSNTLIGVPIPCVHVNTTQWKANRAKAHKCGEFWISYYIAV